jgi:peptidyl-prolyl cis-trans isomerase C
MKRSAVITALAVTLVIILGIYAMKKKDTAPTGTAVSESETPKEQATDTPVTANPEDSKVLAKYNGKTLTKGEINEKIKELSGGKMPEGKSDVEQFPKEVQDNIIKGIIVGKLLSEEADKLNLQNDEKVKKSLETVRDQIIQQAVVAHKVKESVSEEALKAKYDEFVKTEGQKEEIKASHILVNTEADAKKVEAELKAGATFEELAKKYSKDSNKDKGGDLGYFSRGQMVPAFENAAYALKVGEVSAPVKSDFGWHIIKLVDRRKAVVPSYEEAKGRFEQELGQKAAQNYIETLQKNANIELLTGDKSSDKNAVPPAANDNAAPAPAQAPADAAPASGDAAPAPAATEAAPTPAPAPADAAPVPADAAPVPADAAPATNAAPATDGKAPAAQ